MFAQKIIQAFFATMLIWECLTPLQAQTRTWTDSSGKFSIEAQLVEVKEVLESTCRRGA